MWPRRHRGQPTEPLGPREQLWKDLRDFFQDDEGWRWASGTVSFVEVDPEDVRRLWDHISAKATSFGDDPRILDFDHETPQDLPPLVEAVDLMLQGEGISTVSAMLEGVQSNGELLPDLFSSSMRTHSESTGGSYIQRTTGTPRPLLRSRSSCGSSVSLYRTLVSTLSIQMTLSSFGARSPRISHQIPSAIATSQRDVALAARLI
jgi:hypothetical protein